MFDLDERSSTESNASEVELSDRDLLDVFHKVCEARDKWYEIGLGLGIPLDKLKAITKDHEGVDACLREMLTYWLQHPNLKRSWNSLAKSLKEEVVDRPDIAKQLTSV